MSSPKIKCLCAGLAAVIKLTYRLMRIDTRDGASASFRLTNDAATERRVRSDNRRDQAGRALREHDRAATRALAAACRSHVCRIDGDGGVRRTPQRARTLR